jgi:hypothetical protein
MKAYIIVVLSILKRTKPTENAPNTYLVQILPGLEDR